MATTNMAKLKAMVHYIAANIPEQQLGKTKLNKILWFSDREAFIQLGKTISGDTYIREKRGPIAASLDKALNELERDGKLLTSIEYSGEYSKYTFHSLVPPQNLPLSKEEKAIFKDKIKEIAPMTAKAISEQSRDYTWEMYDNGEEIDMAAVLARPIKVTKEMLEWATR